MPEYIEHIDGATVIYTHDSASPHHIDFVAVELIATHVIDGRGYNRKDARFSPDFVFDPHDAEPYVSGTVKWDGCVNYTVGTDSVMMHACGRRDLEKLSRVLVTVFERCGALMLEHGGPALDDEFRYTGWGLDR